MTMSTNAPTSTISAHKRVRICLESVRVHHMPQDNREEYLDKLFYSPQELKVFQDEKFEEEAAALRLKKEKQAAEKKKQKEIKKKQRKEKLRARKQARLAKKNNHNDNHNDNDSDYGLLSTSSSDSEEPTPTYSLSRDAQSTKRPIHTSRRLRNRKTDSTRLNTHPTISLDLSALEQGINNNNNLQKESSPCSTPSSVSTATTECSTPPPLSPTESLQEHEDDLQTACNYNHEEEEEDADHEDLELAVSLLPKQQQQQQQKQDPTQNSLLASTTSTTLLTDNLQRQLKQWKTSTLILSGLLILSWIYFSFLFP